MALKSTAMKVCKNCGTENPESATECSWCGGVDFRHICLNCGTEFENGSFCPQCGMKAGSNTALASTKKTSTKRKTWLWVLGWIFIFPVPLTVLLLRNSKLNSALKFGAIAIAWLFYLFAVFTSGGSDEADVPTVDLAETAPVEIAANNIEEMAFSHIKEVTVEAGQTVSPGYLRVSVNSRNDFSPENVTFISENPEIAKVTFSHDALTTCLYFDVIGISEGETNIYATASEGTIKSDKLHIIVTRPVEDAVTQKPTDNPATPEPTEEVVSEPVKVEKIDLTGYRSELSAGEETSIQAVITPSNAENQALSWSSSDENVVTVNDNGTIVAVGSGTATITATADGVSATAEIKVIAGGDTASMKLTVRHT